MKVTVNVECTPEEARKFMGLPDVQPMQEALMGELQERLTANIRSLTPDSMMNTWMPAGMQNVEQLQKMFWEQVQSTFAGVTSATTDMMNYGARKSGS